MQPTDPRGGGSICARSAGPCPHTPGRAGRFAPPPCLSPLADEPAFTGLWRSPARHELLAGWKQLRRQRGGPWLVCRRSRHSTVRGRFDPGRLLGLTPPAPAVYCCGPERLLSAVEALGAQRGFAVHVRRFAPKPLPTGENIGGLGHRMPLCRSASTLCLSSPVALRGPSGPGHRSVNRLIFPVRSTGGHLVHAGGGVPPPVGDLGGGHVPGVKQARLGALSREPVARVGPKLWRAPDDEY